VPLLIETVEDVANLPIIAGPNAVVRARDLATIRSTFKDAETITRLDGKPAIAIEVSKAHRRQSGRNSRCGEAGGQ
jgi:multidrug efflux pump